MNSIQKALTELAGALDPEDQPYFAGLRRRAYAAIRAGKPQRLDAIRVEIKARAAEATAENVFDAVLSAALYLFTALLESQP